MDKLETNLMNDDDLMKVSGGTEIEQNNDEDFTGDTIPFCCTACNTIMHIKPGQKTIKCVNPRCGKMYHIDG